MDARVNVGMETWVDPRADLCYVHVHGQTNRQTETCMLKSPTIMQV